MGSWKSRMMKLSGALRRAPETKISSSGGTHGVMGASPASQRVRSAAREMVSNPVRPVTGSGSESRRSSVPWSLGDRAWPESGGNHSLTSNDRLRAGPAAVASHQR